MRPKKKQNCNAAPGQIAHNPSNTCGDGVASYSGLSNAVSEVVPDKTRGDRIVRFVFFLVVWMFSWAGASAQVLQPGDTIAIGVYQDSKLDRQVVIGPTGQISFPLAGQIRAGGLTPEGLEKALKARLKDKYTAQLDITVTVVATAKPDEEQKARFFVTGEVNRPGPQLLRPGTTVLQAISMAGGVAQFAAKKRIQIRRTINGQEATLLFDYAAYERGSSAVGNIELQPGDVIIVPERGFLE